MAKSGLIQGSVSQRTTVFRSYIYWREVGQSVANNTSTVTAEVLIDATGDSWKWNGTVSNFQITINGSQTTEGNFNSNNTNGWTYNSSTSPTGRVAHRIYSITVTIPHNSDGSKTFSASSSFSLPSGGWGPGNVSISGNGDLDVIARASSITGFANFNVNQSSSISISRADSSFTHTLQLYVGSTYICQRTSVATSHTLTLSDAEQQSLYNAIGGSNSATVTLRCYTYSSGNLVGSYTTRTATASKPSASTVSYSNFTIGNSISVTINRSSNLFTHTLVMKIGSTTVFTRTGIGASTTVTMSTGEQDILYAAMSSVEVASVSLSCSTFSGSVKIRSDTNLNRNATVPSTIVPTFTTITHSENVSSVSSVGAGYIQNMSRLNLAITGATGAKSSTISSYRITFEGLNYNHSSAVSEVIKGSGTITITGVVTDSRGRSATKSVNVTISAYSAPRITTFKLFRANSDGTANELGTHVRVERAGTITTLDGNNSWSVNVYSRNRGTTSWGAAKNTAYGFVANMNSAFTLSGYDVFQSYDFRLDFQDAFNTSISLSVLSTGEVTMSWGRSGVGIGKIHENGALDVNGNVYIDGIVNVSRSINVTLGAKVQQNLMVGSMSDPSYTLHVNGDARVSGISRFASGSRLVGSNTGNTNVAWFGFYQSNDTTRDAYMGIGDPANRNFSFVADGGEVILQSGIGATLTIGADGTGARVMSPAVYSRTYQNEANMYVTSFGTLGRANVSSIRYKINVTPIDDILCERILELTPKQWFDRNASEDYADYLTKIYNGEEAELPEEMPRIETIPGLIAEELEAAGLSKYVIYGPEDEDGNRSVEGLMYSRLWTLLIPIIKRQQGTIENLKIEVETLKHLIGG